MSEPFLSPTPWTYRNTGGPETVVDRHGRIVAIVLRGFEPGNGAVMAAAPELLEALREYVRLSDVSLDSLERVAAEFHKATGFLAPGKDIPAAMDSDAYRAERHQHWNEWVRAKDAARLARARAALAKAEARE